MVRLVPCPLRLRRTKETPRRCVKRTHQLGRYDAARTIPSRGLTGHLLVYPGRKPAMVAESACTSKTKDVALSTRDIPLDQS